MEEPRGHWEQVGDGPARRWIGGTSSWTDAHGASTVHYSFGRPLRVENASLPDGTTVPHAETIDAVNHDIWRRPDGSGGYILGTMLILEGSATFTYDPVLDAAWKADPAEDEDALPIQRALSRDPEFMRRIQDDAFADAVYASFCNREWRHADGERHSMSWRRSGGMVAHLRRRGESYTDWYPWSDSDDRESREIAEVEAAYARLGWTELTDAERTADHELALALLDEVEARPPGERKPPPGPYGPKNMDERTAPYARAWKANQDGRASDAEFGFISDRLIPERRREMAPEEFAALISKAPGQV